MASDRRKQIKRRLREIKRDPASAQPGEAQRLAAEYRRIQSAERAPDPAPAVAPIRGLTEADADAVATWPPELRARLQRSAFSRVIDRGSSVNDPDNWGAKNDLRRR